MTSRIAAAPPFPATARDVYGSTNPLATSCAVIKRGNDGKDGVDSNARAPRPTIVPKARGMAKYAFPPMIYPGTADAISAENPWLMSVPVTKSYNMCQ